MSAAWLLHLLAAHECCALRSFVQGAGRQLADNVEADTCWGGSFTDTRDDMERPVDLVDLTKLVFSPHSYGPSLYKLPLTQQWMPRYFTARSFPDNLPDVWEKIWGFATEEGLVRGVRLEPPVFVILCDPCEA